MKTEIQNRLHTLLAEKENDECGLPHNEYHKLFIAARDQEIQFLKGLLSQYPDPENFSIEVGQKIIWVENNRPSGGHVIAHGPEYTVVHKAFNRSDDGHAVIIKTSNIIKLKQGVQ